jgi:competence protein ComFC
VAAIGISGPWDEGYALALHTLSSDFLGYDNFGNPQFDTKRTKLGELVFRLKNRRDEAAVAPIAEAVAAFVTEQKLKYDLIVPVPPSRERTFQPTVEIARAVSERVNKPMREKCVRKVKPTGELKNVYEYSERVKVLKDAFEGDAERVKGERILLIDDLYRSGATMKAVAKALQAAGAERIVALAVTKTRTKI